ncbi:MAG: hypothetical protein A2161_10035 [Candidatus Schekmanbacteria bacterium RBG_13_48_7]|uniref:Uncharacterized protein n=1 Tax=Candidatus Schekmanbacteria bacterium RBG_13_48_7 TaxID=1817878 RepID=A0A1F7S0N9_9BACT|nr:MAG: hypothetical protein A2161_10035 [Candidatus Schekmanbacteria bacterium RBG_13_48_7]
MKLVVGFLCLVMSCVFSYLMFIIFRSYLVSGIAFTILFILLIITWSSDKEEDVSYKDYFLNMLGRKQSKTPEKKSKSKPKPEPDKIPPVISKFSDSIIISQRMRGVVFVGIKEKAVKEFEKECSIEKSVVPLYMACKALDISEKALERIINSRDGFTVQQVKASEKQITAGWGKEKTYYIQLNTDYF